MNSATTHQGFWSEDYPFELMLKVLLAWASEAPSIDDDQIARLCLTPQELATLLPVDQHAGRALETVNGLAEFLDEEGSSRPLAGALRDWRATMNHLRAHFGWLQLSPALNQRAHQRARHLMTAVKQRGLMIQKGHKWLLTDQGRQMVGESAPQSS